MEPLPFLTVIVLLAAVNVAVGYFLACAWDRPRPPPASQRSVAVERHAESQAQPTSCSQNQRDALRLQWRTQLEQMGLADVDEPCDALWMVHCEVLQLQRRLLVLDREALLSPKRPTPEEVREEVTRLATPLVQLLREAGCYCRTSPHQLPAFVPLSDVLEDYARQLEELCQRHTSDHQRQPWQTGDPRREVYQQLSEFSHRLRDELHDRLAAEIAKANRTITIPESLLLDSTAGIWNRLGIEREATHYRMSVPVKVPVSAILVDIDRFQRVHHQLGVYRAEKLLEQFSQTVLAQLRTERGFDRMGRLSGPAFLVTLGNTKVLDGVRVAERLRQSIEASSFTVGEHPLELTISCGVVEWPANEPLADIVRRLRLALSEARRSGRNRTCVDDGSCLHVVTPEPLGVQGHVISVAIN